MILHPKHTNMVEMIISRSNQEAKFNVWQLSANVEHMIKLAVKRSSKLRASGSDTHSIYIIATVNVSKMTETAEQTRRILERLIEMLI